MSVRGIVEAYEKEIKVLGFEDLKDGLELDMIGLKGSPTNVYQSFTKEVKGAGTILEGLSADEAVKAIMDKLEAKLHHLIYLDEESDTKFRNIRRKPYNE